MVHLCPDFFPSQILGLQRHHIDLCIGMAHVTVKKKKGLKLKRLILGKAICFFQKTFLSQGDSNSFHNLEEFWSHLDTYQAMQPVFMASMWARVTTDLLPEAVITMSTFLITASNLTTWK